jgi:hypothetical protein
MVLHALSADPAAYPAAAAAVVADVINLVMVEQARPNFNAKVPKVRGLIVQCMLRQIAASTHAQSKVQS